MRHCATARKVAGSIPDSVIGIFHWHNPSSRTMPLGSTQPRTEMSTRNISLGLRRPVRGLTTLLCADCREILGASTFRNPQGLSSLVQGLLYLYLYMSQISSLCSLLHYPFTSSILGPKMFFGTSDVRTYVSIVTALIQLKLSLS